MALFKSQRKKRYKSIVNAMMEGSTTCPAFPLEWFFELSTRCNIRCRTCGRLYDHRFNAKKYTGNMSPGIMDRVEDSLQHALVVHSVGFGEPFMNPHALDFIRRIKEQGPFLDVITNGTLLDRHIEALVDTGLDSMAVSMDGGTPEVFEYFRDGAKWAPVVAALEKLKAYKESRQKTTPRVMIEFVAMKDNLHTFPDLVREAAGRLGASGVTVEPLYQAHTRGYVEFYQQQNLSNVPFEEVQRILLEGRRIAEENGLEVTGPYFGGDMEVLWKNARLKMILTIDHPEEDELIHPGRPFHGWCVSPCGIEKVTCILNSTTEVPVKYGLERMDVAETMPEAGERAVRSGFEAAWEPWMLKNGENRLKFVFHEKDGEVTETVEIPFRFDGSRSVAPPALPCIQVDFPKPGGECDDRLVTIGWTYPPHPDRIEAHVDGKPVGELLLGLPRKDVEVHLASRVENEADALYSGFMGSLDLSGLDEGDHTLRLVCSGRSEYPRSAREATVDFKLVRGSRKRGRSAARPAGTIEQPADEASPLQGIVVIMGWGIYGDDTDRLAVTCDGNELHPLFHGLIRQDLAGRPGLEGLSDKLGYAVPLDTRFLENGDHVFRLEARGPGGRMEVLCERTCRVDNPDTIHDVSRSAGTCETGATGAAMKATCSDACEASTPTGPGSTERTIPDTTPMSPPAEADVPERHAQANDVPSPETKRKPGLPYCPLPWTTFYVTFEGKVRPCCFVEHGMSLGDLNEQSVEEIWNGEAFRKLRKNILEGTVTGFCKACVENKRIHGRDFMDRLRHLL